MRDLLNTGAQLIATAENLRLQRRVLWLTVISLIVAAIAAAAAVLALRTSTSSPTPPRPVPARTVSATGPTPDAPGRIATIRASTSAGI